MNPCTNTDTCAEGICKGLPVICDQPPANSCKDEATMLAFDHTGLCTGGRELCTYAVHEVACASGCADGLCAGDPCAGQTCDTAPGACFAAPGTCAAGSCSFSFADGDACDDGNACTADETCASGVCTGMPKVCNEPAADTCQDATTLLHHVIPGTCDPANGACSYEVLPVVCPGVCVDGVCVEAIGLLQADLLPGGALGLSDPDGHEAACVLPGWNAGIKLESANWTLTGGFEP